jgi:hypothetical protein
MLMHACGNARPKMKKRSDTYTNLMKAVVADFVEEF